MSICIILDLWKQGMTGRGDLVIESIPAGFPLCRRPLDPHTHNSTESYKENPGNIEQREQKASCSGQGDTNEEENDKK